VLRIPEVNIDMAFTLSAANGRTISDVSARAESYSGSDTLGMALTLVNEQASGVVAQLYSDYCRNAGISSNSGKKKK
jgi:C4-dicarboxylate transporter